MKPTLQKHFSITPFSKGGGILVLIWIVSGYVPLFSKDLDWWSLKPIEAKASPGGSIESGNPVDGFIDAELKAQGLIANGDARPVDLIRRLSYDLTGMPPTPQQVKRFVTEAAEDMDRAVQQEVDRLLNSPGFGEKWGQHWLDLARYGETHGYDKDKPRNAAWPYRDYVIRSFNEDKSYARFVREQVAGDVLFLGEPDGVLGLGFLAAGPWDFIGHWEVGEGKLDGRIAKHLDRDEMVSAVFNVFMSTTVQCAQCHHHKFDPVRMEDYYRLHAVFAAVDRAERPYTGLAPEQEERKAQLLAEIGALSKEKDNIDGKVKRAIAAKASGLDRRIAELKEKYGTGLKPQYGYHSQIVNKQEEVKWVQVDLGSARSVSQVRLIPAFDQYAGIGAGFGFPVRYKVEAGLDPEMKKGVRLLLDRTDKDQPNPLTATIPADVGGERIRYIRVTATKLAERKNDYIFALGELEAVTESGENLAAGRKVTSLDSIEAKVRWGRSNLTDGIFYRELSSPDALEELKTLQEKRSQIVRESTPPGTDERVGEINDRVGKLNKELSKIPKGSMVYAAAARFQGGGRFIPTGGRPREIHLLNRGDMKSPRERMSPGGPPLWEGTQEVFLSGETWDEGKARARLAEYLTDRENPLVWRSMANRIWQWTFGRGLVSSANDFGRMGQTPSHPALLDWLAAKLRDDPSHSIKSMVRLLMTSRAYRRSCESNELNVKVDAGNRFLWQGNRRRMTAEEYRDSLLMLAGVMNRKMGGPSFHDFVIEKPQHSPHYEYHLHQPEDPKSHRRSIYRFVVRSQPQPFLTTLDCADPSMSIARRDESTTALQALAQWNNRLVAYASEEFGKRINAHSGDPGAKLTFAFREALGRAPSPEEQKILKGHLEKHGPANLTRVLFNMNGFVYID